MTFPFYSTNWGQAMVFMMIPRLRILQVSSDIIYLEITEVILSYTYIYATERRFLVMQPVFVIKSSSMPPIVYASLNLLTKMFDFWS